MGQVAEEPVQVRALEQEGVAQDLLQGLEEEARGLARAPAQEGVGPVQALAVIERVRRARSHHH